VKGANNMIAAEALYQMQLATLGSSYYAHSAA